MLDLMSSQYLQSGLGEDLVSKVLAFKYWNLSNPELCEDAERLYAHRLAHRAHLRSFFMQGTVVNAGQGPGSVCVCVGYLPHSSPPRAQRPLQKKGWKDFKSWRLGGT